MQNNRQLSVRIPKNRKRVLKTLPVGCLMSFDRFSERLEAVLGDFHFNGRCDVMSRTKEKAST